MKKKVIIVIYVLLVLILVKLIYNQVLNRVIINNYNNKVYLENYAKTLTFMNFSEPYIANYNYGNILFKNGKYDEAIEQYYKALDGNIPKEKECNIRINFALSICKTVNVDESDKESVENAIQDYEFAIEVLTENGCAGKLDDNGHSEEAEQLKKDIQKEIDRLRNKDNSSESKQDEQKNEEKETNQKDTEQIEEKIQEIKENAVQNQREMENENKNFGNYEYNSQKRNW